VRNLVTSKGIQLCRKILDNINYNRANGNSQPRSKFRDSREHRPGRLPGPYQIGTRARFEYRSKS